MINVEVFRECDKIVGYKIKGHANSGPRGEDVVCAAVSMLGQSTLVGLEEVISVGIQADISHGNMNIKLDTSDPSLLDDSQVLLETMLITMQTLICSDKYSRFITLSVKDKPLKEEK